MQSRREMLAGLTALAGGALGVGAGLLAPSSAKAADRLVSLSAMGPRNFHSYDLKALGGYSRFAVPSYRFGVVVRNGLAASSQGGFNNVDSMADLVGISREDMSAAADLCVRDFIAQITATGRTLVPNSELGATTGGQQLEASAEPFIKKPFADSRTVAVVSPNGMALYNRATDAPLTDKGPFNQGNDKALVRMSAEAQCIVMVPSLVLDFAQLTGSGHRVYGGASSVGIVPGMFLTPLFCSFTWYHATDPRFPRAVGKMILKERVAVGQAGQLVQTSSYNNAAEIAWWNATGQFDENRPAGPTRSYNYSSYQYRVDRQMFNQVSLDAAAAMHRILASAAAANAPA